MHAIVRGLVGAGATVAVASAATTGWNSVDPDNPVANQIQMARKRSLPGDLAPWEKEGPIDGRVALIFASGLNNETNPDGLMSDGTVTHTFEMSVTNWRSIFQRKYPKSFDECFVMYKDRYDCRKDIVQNARWRLQRIEADPELTLKGTYYINVDHSMGDLIGIQSWLLDETKCAGMVGSGGPLGGSPWADPVELRRCCVAWLGTKKGNALSDLLLKQVDFNTDGMRGLRRGAKAWAKQLEAKPLDENCYLFFGHVAPAKGKVLPVGLLGLEHIWGAASKQDVAYQKAAQAYPLLSAVMWAGGYGPNDGMVPTSFTKDPKIVGKAHVRIIPYEADHAEVVKGSGGDLLIDEMKADALWAIYCSVHKEEKELGAFDERLPDSDIVSGLKGFGPKVSWPVDVWWWDHNGNLVVADTAGQVKKLSIRPRGEVDVDEKGTKLAVPTRDGTIVYDLATGKSRIVSKDASTAVAWYGQQLVVASKARLSLLDPEQHAQRVLVADDGFATYFRPAIAGGRVYWANGDSPFSCYTLTIDDVHSVPLQHDGVEKLDSGSLCVPRKGKQSVLGVYPEGEQTKLQWFYIEPAAVDQRILKETLNRLITSKVVGEVSDVAVASDGNVYLAIDGEIRHLDFQVAKSMLAEGTAKRAIALFKRESKVEMVLDIDKLAPAIGEGDHLGAR